MAYTVGESACIIDVKDPAKPLKLGDLPIEGTGHSIWVESNKAFVATSTGLEIIDLSNPSQPKKIGHCGEGPARSIVCVDDIAYVANRMTGLEIIDISEPDMPVRLATLQETQSAWNLHRYQDYLFLGRHQNGVDIFDIKNRRNPVRIGNFCDDDGGEALSVWGDNKYIYVADNFGVEVLDIAEPERPRQISEIGNMGCTHDITADDRYIYVASAEYGLILLEFHR